MMELLEKRTFHGVEIFYYGTYEDGCLQCECLGQAFPDEDAAQAAIVAAEAEETEAPDETAERLDDWRRRQWELV